MKASMLILLAAFTSFGYAADGSITDAEVNGLVVYEVSDDATRVKLIVNNQSRVGPNPDSPSTDCELWTDNASVYAAALTAKTTGNKVKIVYTARGDAPEFCSVRYLQLL